MTSLSRPGHWNELQIVMLSFATPPPRRLGRNSRDNSNYSVESRGNAT